MSITLDYVSIDPVPSPVAVEVIKSSQVLMEQHDWWAEPITLSVVAKDKRLVGSTRIRLGGYGFVEVPKDEEALMVCHDTRFLVDQLASWSAKYSLSWQLSEIGSDVGTVISGKADSKLVNYVARLCSGLKLPMSAVSDVLKKHETRKD